MANKIVLGIIALVILSASVYVISQDNSVRLDIKKTYSEFSVYENESWVLGGEERSVLFDGTAKMRASKREVNYTFDNKTNTTTIYRYSFFKNGIIVIDTYYFDGNEKSVELFPISHTINILGAKTAQVELGKNTEFIFMYEVSKLGYYGETNTDLGSAHEFDHNMKVEWSDGNYYERVYKYADKNEGKLEIKYRVDSDNFTVSARLFDPIISTDTVFSKLISLKSELTYGEAIFEFKNPVDNLNMQDMYITTNILKGEGIKSVSYYIKEETPYEVQKYRQEKVEVECAIQENNTNISINKSSLNESVILNNPQENNKCYEYKQIEDGFDVEYEINWKKVDYLDKGKYEIKMVVNYVKPGTNVFEWFPNLNLDKNKYTLPRDMYGKVESKKLKQDKW